MQLIPKSGLRIPNKLPFHADFCHQEPSGNLVQLGWIDGNPQNSCKNHERTGRGALVVAFYLEVQSPFPVLDRQDVLVQVDFLAPVVRDGGEGLAVEPLHQVCGDSLRCVAVHYGLGEMLAELFFQGLDVHDFHAPGEGPAQFLHQVRQVLRSEVQGFQKFHANQLAVSLHAEGERPHVHDFRLGAESFAELHRNPRAKEGPLEETEHVVVGQEPAESGLLEGNLVAVALLLAGPAVGHQFLDFFGSAAWRLVAHGIVGQFDFVAEAGNAALLAVAPLAVGNGGAIRVKGLFPFPPQVLLGGTGVDKVPGEHFVLVPFTIHPAGVVACLLPDLFPLGKVEPVRIALEDDSLLVGLVDDGPEAAVASAVDGFQETG